MHNKKDQHYIPKFILRRHKNTTSNDKKDFIYQYNKQLHIVRNVDKDNECKKKHLYECDGALSKNFIENFLERFDNKWDKVLIKIENEEALSEEDVMLIYLLFAYQILRTPMVMEYTKELFESVLKDTYTQQDIDNWIKVSSFLPDNIVGEEVSILKQMLHGLEDREFYILKISDVGDTPSSVFVISKEYPVFCLLLSDGTMNSNVEHFFFFPVAPGICLSLLAKDMVVPKYITGEQVSYLNNQILEKSDEIVYCSKNIWPDAKYIPEPPPKRKP